MPNALAVAGPDSRYAAEGATPAGFLAGLWHGIISPVTFVVGVVVPGVRMYETRNNGAWYDLGFIVGVSVTFGGSGSRVL